VTAAHCVYGEQQPVKVIYGDFTDEVKFTDEEKTKVIYGDVTVHEGYARPRECDVQEGCDENENDIAVIKLRSEVPRRYAINMCESSYSNHTIAVCGMGRTDFKKILHGSSDYLMEVRLKESKKSEWPGGEGCYPMANTKGEICLMGDNNGEEKGGVNCYGDGGGPVYPLDKRNQPICLYGLVSYGSVKCNGWSVHTRVSYYYNWVKQFMKTEDAENEK